MSPRSVWPWVLAAAVAVLLALWAMSSRAPQQDVRLDGPLFAELTQRANSIEQVTIVGGGDQTLVTLKQEGEQWVMPDRDGFPVDAAKLRALLLSLANARRAEAKTANPELYSRLGVEDVSLADAGGVLLRLSGGGESLEVIIGQNVARGSGTYVRIAGEPQSWLLDRSIAVERKPVEWLQRELVNLPPARIQSVVVTPAEGASISIIRSDAGAGNFQLENVPKGREPISEFAADATAGLLDSLRFDEVAQKRERPDAVELARLARFETIEGLVIELQSWREEGKTFAELSATLDETKALAWASTEPEEGTESADDESAAAGPAAQDAASQADNDSMQLLRDELAQLQTRFAERTFVVPAFKASSLNRSLDEYLKPQE